MVTIFFLMTDLCVNCRASQNLLYCSRCQMVKYCSIECQKECWVRHKSFCKLITKIFIGDDAELKIVKRCFKNFCLSEHAPKFNVEEEILNITVHNSEEHLLDESKGIVLGISDRKKMEDLIPQIRDIDKGMLIIYVTTVKTKNARVYLFNHYINIMVQIRSENQSKLIVSTVSTFCNNCDKPFSKTFICSRCRKRRYCSEKCRDENWETHKADCVLENTYQPVTTREISHHVKFIKTILNITESGFESSKDYLVITITDREKYFSGDFSSAELRYGLKSERDTVPSMDDNNKVYILIDDVSCITIDRPEFEKLLNDS